MKKQNRFVFATSTIGKTGFALALVTFLLANLGHAQTPDQSWFSECSQGNLQACNSLGNYFDRSDQPARAAEYYRRVCDGGAMVGCSNIAELYFDGRGVQRDNQTAFEFFRAGCGGSVLSGCAGMCLTLSKAGQLNPDARPACETALQKACDTENSWMCNRQLVKANTSKSSAQGCQGQELARTRQVVEVSWLVGLELGESLYQTGDLVGAMNRLLAVSQQLNKAGQQLPYACQMLIQQWSNAISAAFQAPLTGTQCMGGVCCDGTGCY